MGLGGIGELWGVMGGLCESMRTWVHGGVWGIIGVHGGVMGSWGRYWVTGSHGGSWGKDSWGGHEGSRGHGNSWGGGSTPKQPPIRPPSPHNP